MLAASLLFLGFVCLITAEVTVLRSVQTLYDRSPKLRIKGTGFDVEDHQIILEIAAQGQPTLKIDKDFLISKDDDGLILKLLSGRRFVRFKNYIKKYISNLILADG